MVQRPDSNCPPHNSQSKSHHPPFPSTHSNLSSASALTSASTSASDSALSQPPTPISTPNPTSNPRMADSRMPDPQMPDPRTSSPSASYLDNPPVPGTKLREEMVCRRYDIPRECEDVSRLERLYGPLSGAGERNGGNSNCSVVGGGTGSGGGGGGGGVGTADCEARRRDSGSAVRRLGDSGRESDAEHDSSFITRTSSERGSVKDATPSELRGRTCPQSAGSISSTPTPPSPLPAPAPPESPPASALQQAQSQPEPQSHTRVGRSFRPPFTKPSHMPFKGLHRSFPSCDDLHQGYDTDVP